jgi:carbonic anhydrase/acetyltransferase-like protein (isoleucine patch superfamily)
MPHQNQTQSFDGHTPTLAEGVFIHSSAIVIGDVHLGKDVSIWPGAVIRGDMHSIHIGEGSNVQDNAVVHVTHASEKYNPAGFPTTIGAHVVIGHSAVVHGCTIEDHVLIGIGAIINDGVHVESGVLIGAGCVVPPGKRLESGFVYVGNPAKASRPLKEAERSFLTYSPQKYVQLKNQYLGQP